MKHSSAFGTELRRLRKRAGLSQFNLAVRAGLPDASTAIALEEGGASATADQIEVIARALRLNADEAAALREAAISTRSAVHRCTEPVAVSCPSA
jgi:transcriptional regulator with XRE-family HTH domain